MMWLSLITGNGDAWRRGAEAQGTENAPAWRLLEAQTPDARAEAFGTLMVP